MAFLDVKKYTGEYYIKPKFFGGYNIYIEPIEPKFKRGDILYSKFFILIYRGTNEYGGVLTDVFLKNKSLDIIFQDVCNGCGCTEWFNLATNSQKQILFDALAKEGKYWDAEAKEVKDFIKVPESIGIYKWFGEEEEYKCGDNLFIGFNNDTQLLGYDDANKCYLVYPRRNSWQKVQCYLQPCKREDLEAGDTVFISRSDYFDNLDMYYKMIDISEYGFARAFGNNIKMVGMKSDLDIRYYKLIPINK